MGFSKDFVWGAAASSYQIEGAVNEEGKGEHIWDVYVKEPGRIYGGHNTAVTPGRLPATIITDFVKTWAL